MTPVAPRIVNDVSYVTRINHHSHFAWQVQYLVELEDDSCCSAHNVNSGSYVSRINHECCFVVLEWYFAVQSSTGVVHCSTGVVLCSTE